MRVRALVCGLGLLLAACAGRSRPAAGMPGAKFGAEPPPRIERPAPGPMDRRLDSLGYVNISALDPAIAVQLVYATPDNFTGEILYEGMSGAYLLAEVADKLVRAHAWLRERHPGYRFVVYDAARSMSVQRRMRAVAVRAGQGYYVANPANGGGLHNYGAAVDLSILDADGAPLPMGTPYDHFGPEAHTDDEGALVRTGALTEAEFQNRLLLRAAMRAAGFRTVASEWWHFNHCSRAEAVARYPLIDF